jgi:opacity protein-like surface antigen
MTEGMPWLGTVRGRLGYIDDGLLLYATAGHAYGRVEVDSSATATEFFVPGSVLLFTLRSNRSGRPRQGTVTGLYEYRPRSTGSAPGFGPLAVTP